jgi:hypothetical protein
MIFVFLLTFGNTFCTLFFRSEIAAAHKIMNSAAGPRWGCPVK